VRDVGEEAAPEEAREEGGAIEASGGETSAIRLSGKKNERAGTLCSNDESDGSTLRRERRSRRLLHVSVART
jgi:hypothetical protein